MPDTEAGAPSPPGRDAIDRPVIADYTQGLPYQSYQLTLIGAPLSRWLRAER